MQRWLAGLLIALVACAGCTPMHSTIDPPYPYKGKTYNEVKIRKIADDTCGIERDSAAPPAIHDFTTDGCSMWLDNKWLECCIEHDIHYWCASPQLKRKHADKNLRQCARAKSNPFNAFFMWLGTRVGGAGWLPFPWRWGYGYPWLQRPEN